MKDDLKGRNDIACVVNNFYDKVRKDDLIAFFFSEVVPVNWEHHLPVMYDFWEQVVFGTGPYHGNPMHVHVHIHSKSEMKTEHFERWVSLFTSTVDEHFSGENAERMKQRAISIATVMQIKISQSKK